MSVIIPHHTGDLIEHCLQSLRRSQGVSWETFVVTSQEGRTFGRDVCPLYTSVGPAQKRNIAAGLARGEYLVFLDDDTEVCLDTLYQFWQWMEDHPTYGMAFGKLLNMERRREFDDCGSWLTWTGFLWARAGNGQRDTGQFDAPTRVLASKSAACGLRRDVFRMAGGFDAAYYILGEETDLAWRCWLRGYECWYVPTAVAYHAFNTSFKPKQQYYTLERIHTYGCRNYLSLLTTNLGFLRASFVLPCHLLVWLLSSMGFFFRGQGTRAVAILRGIRQYFGTLPDMLRKRRHVQATRVRTDRELWPWISYNPPLTYYLGRMRRYLTQGLHG